jgi:hypothetical protein
MVSTVLLTDTVGQFAEAAAHSDGEFSRHLKRSDEKNFHTEVTT